MQLDDTSLAYLNDPQQRAMVAAQGGDAEHQHELYIRNINAALAGRPEGLQVTVDRRRFDVILANLVGNAIRYGEPPVQLLAWANPGLGELRITVADHGPGITDDALPHIFERFYKAESARTRSGGSGLGLAIALENARLHGGDLVAANRADGTGAVFTLALPAAGVAAGIAAGPALS